MFITVEFTKVTKVEYGYDYSVIERKYEIDDCDYECAQNDPLGCFEVPADLPGYRITGAY